VIVGTGVDIVTISRIEQVQARFADRFERRFLHPSEITTLEKSKRAGIFLAKRFAIKEAAVKALGTGERGGVLLRDFYVEHNDVGKPLLQVCGKAAELCTSMGVTGMHVSLSDEQDQVVAFVVLEAN